MTGGFVLIHRSLYDHPAFRDLSEAECFAWMISMAAWQTTRVRYKDRVIYLKRGELALSVRDLAHKHGRSQTWAHRFLNRLKSETLVETHHETGVNVISICNYSKYQDRSVRGETGDETAVGTPPEHHRNTEQTIEQGNKDYIARRTMLPEDWKPPPIAELSPKAQECAQAWPRGAYGREGESFANYWRGERKMKVDWKATWANHILRRNSYVMRDASGGGYSRQRQAVAEGQKSYEFLESNRR